MTYCYILRLQPKYRTTVITFYMISNDAIILHKKKILKKKLGNFKIYNTDLTIDCTK